MTNRHLAAAVEQALGAPVAHVDPAGGGCISDAAGVDLADGRRVFAKSASRLPDGLLDVEADGLSWLGAVEGVLVPAVLAVTGEVLVLEWIEPGLPRPTTDESLGRRLARLHRAGADGFGWHRDGFIGALPQRNAPADDWPSFWFTRRIEPLARAALDRGHIAPRSAVLVERLGSRLGERLAGPPEPPARLHGDLWSGNVHVDREGEPWLIDPAPYGGHREADLAMLHLFGAPSPRCVAAYQEDHPLADGWRERLRLWQLEPLLTHAVMFGGGYGASALAVLERFA
ncbi:MAG TPA: fructosamine kinase family protein [Acidimicrobiales bacterium]|nr:fructosamine kinase family protein [Acidimicrobiales bacterium]